MADNAFVTQGLYLGVEATRGVAVPATRRVLGFDLTSKIDATAQEFRPLGSKFVTIDALQQEWTSGTIGGAPCYTELPYLLSSAISQTNPAPAQQMDGGTGTGAYKWVFDTNAFDVDNPVTYTVEQGNSVRGRRFSYAMLTDYSLSLARNAVTHTGTVMAQQHQDNFAPTSISLPAPSLTSAAPAGTGGTIPAGTYFYQVSAINASGETLPSNEVSATTTGTTSSVVLTWATVAGATGYRIYRANTSGGEATSPAFIAAVGAVLTYTDTAAAPSAGATATQATATPAAPLPSTSLTPILASQVDVFLDPTYAALGTTRQSRIFKVDPHLSGRYKPVWPLDSSKPSWAAHVEGPIAATCNFTAEYDAQGAAYLAQLRAGATAFMRVRAIGPRIYTGGITVNHSVTLDMAVKIKQTDAFSDTDGVFAIGYGADIVYDGGWGKAIHAEVVTTLAAL